MLRFLQFLEEALTKKQTQTVNRWVRSIKGTSPAEQISGHLPFDQNGRMFIPLEKSPDAVQGHVTPEIEQHLKQKGFTPVSSTHAEKEYETTIPAGPRKGEVIKKKETQRIGKLLADSPHLQQAHAEFERNKGVKSDKKKMVVISRNPIDVAGMSTGRKYGTSCKRMSDETTGDMGGCNKHYLEHDIKSNGTHVAYLVDEDDVNVENPHARISLNPFVSASGKHTILRPSLKSKGSDELKQYGDGGQDFAHTVKKWTETHMGMHPNEDSYQIHPDAYDDTNLNDPKTRSTIFNPNLSSEGLHKIIKSGNPSAVKHAFEHPAIDSTHVESALKHPSIDVQLHGLAHPKAPKSALDDAMFNSMDHRKHEAVLRNKNVTPEHVKAGLNHWTSEVVMLAARSPKAREEDLHAALQRNNLSDPVRKVIQSAINRKETVRKLMAARTK